jgi:hypothetical protein
MEHKIKNKLFINNIIIEDDGTQEMCDTLLKMGISSGDLTRLEPFTENKGNYTKPYHNIEFTVIKVVKVAKKTYNSCFYNAVEIYLDDLNLYK